jgi:hypothetical protein
LALLATRIPIEKQDSIFSKASMENLIKCIFRGTYNFRERKDARFEGRVAQLAALLVQLGTQECIEQYRSKVEPNDTLNEPIISHLKRTQEICDEIALKIYLPYVKSTVDKGLDYLFNWDRIHNMYNVSYNSLKGDDKAFVDFIASSWPIPGSIEYIRDNKNSKEFKFLGFIDLEGYIEIVRADLSVKVVLGETIVTTLPIKLVSGEMHVFASKNNVKDLMKYYGLDR